MPGATIEHISDTALFVAAYRAEETQRADAAFRDPLAARLAGERGAALARSLKAREAMAFSLVVRTAAIDRLVSLAIERGVDTVINLGAGLDTRPYRMDLPASLRWVEVDLPALVAYKDAQLADERPVCQLRRIGADLSQDSVRRELLAELGRSTQNALVITEGLLGYLSNEQAEAISRDLFAIPSFQYWVLEYAQGAMRKLISRPLATFLKKTPVRLDTGDPLGFFRGHGWSVGENRFILDEADRIGRPFPNFFPWNVLLKRLPGVMRPLGNRTYGYLMLARPGT